ncbi:MAG: Ig-like domain repeat protein [Nakamurella sp.]
MLPGSYRPTDDTSAGPDSYPAPAVVDPAASTPAPADLGVFSGSSTAGTWTLYLVDDEAGDPADPASALPGALGGWCLTFHQVAPTVTELVGPSTIVASQRASYRATVRSDGSRAPGGSVLFKDGSKQLGRSAVGADGVATLITAAVAVGNRTITASYDGTGIWQDSTSVGFSTKVVPAATELILTATTTGGANHPKVRLKAAVGARSPATAAVDGGTVDFSTGGRKIGSGTVSASGEVSTEVDAGEAPGTVTYRADYRGTTGFAASTATAEAEVPKIPTKVRGGVVTDDPTFGSPVTVSVQISEDRGGRAPVTAGTTRLLVDGVPAGVTGTPDRSGAVSLTVGSLPAGTRRLTVEYQGTDSWASSSGSETIRVDRATSDTVLRAAPTPSTYGSPITLTATVTAGSQGPSSGSVTFSDGWTTLGTAGVRNGTASLTLDRPGPGDHHFVADFSGTDDVRSSSGAADHEVRQAVTTAVVALDAARIRPDRATTATVRISSPVGDVQDGLVTLRVDGQPVLAPRPVGADGVVRLELPRVPVGNHRIQAYYSGSDSFAPSTADAGLVVEPIAVVVVVGVDVAPAAPQVGRSATFRAAVREIDGTPVTVGRIEFTLDGTPVATAAVDAAGDAEIFRPLLSAHRLQLRARYLPDADHSPRRHR